MRGLYEVVWYTSLKRLKLKLVRGYNKKKFSRRPQFEVDMYLEWGGTDPLFYFTPD